MIQRPAAVIGLDAAQIDADLALQFEVRRLGEIVHEQDIFRRDRRVGLELEHPMAVLALAARAAPRWRRGSQLVDGDRASRSMTIWFMADYTAARERQCAAFCPERTRPRWSRAGRCRSSRRPASRLGQRVRGLRALGAPVPASRRRSRASPSRSATAAIRRADCSTAATSRHRSARERLALHVDEPVGAADRSIEMRSGKANIHSTVPPITPIIGGVPAGGAILKCALTMARKSSGASIPGSSSCATQGGTARIDRVAFGEPRPCRSGNSSAQTRAPSNTMRRSRWPRRDSRALARRGSASAGSTNAAARVGWAMRGR